MNRRPEARRFSRVPLTHEIGLRLEGDETEVRPARLVDISRSGLRCVGELPAAAPGTSVTVVLRARRWLVLRETFDVDAVLRRTDRDRSEWALDLHPGDEETRRRLDRYVARAERAHERVERAVGASSALAESLRMIRVQLGPVDGERVPRVVAITSAVANEGKSFLAAGLGVVLASEGHRVLVVDCDLDRPSLHESFGLRPSPGVARLLAGGPAASLRELVQRGFAGTWVLTADPRTDEPHFYRPESVDALVRAVRSSEFDFVILDSPPLLETAGSILLACAADDVLVAVRSGQTRESDLRRAKVLLEQHHVDVRGIVLNDCYGMNQTRYGGGGTKRASSSPIGRAFGRDSRTAVDQGEDEEGVLGPPLGKVTTVPADRRRA
jgi:protein-tyrosine kinase